MASYQINSNLKNSTFNSSSSSSGSSGDSQAVLLYSDQSIYGTKTFENSVVDDQNLSVNGDTILNNLTVNGDFSSYVVTNALNTKANDNTVVHNTLDETISGQKTFIDNTICSSGLNVKGNCYFGDHSDDTHSFTGIGSHYGTEKFVGEVQIYHDASIGTTSTDTLLVKSDTTFNNNVHVNGVITCSDLTNQLNTKANDNEVVHLTNTESIGGAKTFNDGISVIGTITNINLTNQLNTKANDNEVVHLTNTESIGGSKTFNDGISVIGTITNINLTNQLNTKANDSAVVHNTLDESITGIKTFTSPTLFNSDMTIGNQYIDTLTVNSDTNFLNGVTIGTTQADILNINSTTLFNNGVTLGKTSSDILSIPATLMGSLKIGNAITTQDNLIIYPPTQFRDSVIISGDLTSGSLYCTSLNTGTHVTSISNATTITCDNMNINKKINSIPISYINNLTSDPQTQFNVIISNVNDNTTLIEGIISDYATGTRVGIIESTYAHLANPSFTGIPMVPTATTGNNTHQIANTAFVSSAIADLISTAPINLNTLSELSAALNNDPNMANNLISMIGLKQDAISSSSTINCGGFTSSSIIDNGNLSVKGNTTIGDNILDTMQVNSLTTFSSGPYMSGNHITSGTILQSSINGLAGSLSLKVDSSTYDAYCSNNDQVLLGKQNIIDATSNLTCGAFTSSSIVDNGNLTVKGNTTLGIDTIVSGITLHDSLIVNAISTFNQPPTMSGALISSGTIPESSVVGLVVDLSNKVGITALTDGLALKQDKIIGSSAITCGSLTASSIQINNNSVIGVSNANSLTVNSSVLLNDPPSMSGSNIYSNSIKQNSVVGLPSALTGKVDQTTYNAYTTANDTLIATKQDIISGTSSLTCGQFTSSSIVDNGNLTVKGNTIIGQDSTVLGITLHDTLIVNAVPTFYQAPNMSGSNITNGTIAQTAVINLVSDLALKVDSSTLNATLSTKANLNSPSLTGIPTSTTAANNTNTTQIATTAFVQSAISDLVGGAPLALNTLSEIANALNNDANLNSTLTNSIATKASQSSFNSYKTATDLALSQLQPIGNYVDQSTSQIISGVKTFMNPPVLSGSSIISGTISQDQISGLTASLANKQTAGNYCDLTTSQSLAGIKTFTDPPVFSGVSIQSASIPRGCITGLNTILAGKQDVGVYCDDVSTQTFGGIKTFSSPIVTSGASITTGTIPQNAINGLSTSLAALTSLSAVQSNANTFTNSLVSQSTMNIMEKVSMSSVVSNNLLINFSNGGVSYITLSAATNFQIQLTNINPASSVNTTCIVTLLINTSSYLAYGNTCTINGTSRSIVFAGGSANVSITSATLVQQTLAIVYAGSSTVPVVVMSSIVPFY